MCFSLFLPCFPNDAFRATLPDRRSIKTVGMFYCGDFVDQRCRERQSLRPNTLWRSEDQTLSPNMTHRNDSGRDVQRQNQLLLNQIRNLVPNIRAILFFSHVTLVMWHSVKSVPWTSQTYSQFLWDGFLCAPEDDASDSDVFLQIVSALKFSPKHITNKWFLTCGNFHVHVNFALLSHSFPTSVTNIWFFSSGDSHGRLQIFQLIKPLPTNHSYMFLTRCGLYKRSLSVVTCNLWISQTAAGIFSWMMNVLSFIWMKLWWSSRRHLCWIQQNG